jgi:hypothetical protein
LLLVRLAGVVVSAVAFAVAGCAARDPFAGAPRPLTVATLPGHAAAAVAPLARSRGATLIAFADRDELYARHLSDDGTAGDRALGPGTLIAVAALDDGFAVAVHTDDGIAVHFLDGGATAEQICRVTLAGTLLPALASDGQRVLLGATRGGEIAIDTPRPLYATLALVSRDAPPVTIDLGEVPAPPSLWGDRQGFVVGGVRLVDDAGTIARAPGLQIAAARLFRRPIAPTHATHDIISVDGRRWLPLDGLVARAASDGDATLVQLDAGDLVRFDPDLTLQARLPSPPAGSLYALSNDVMIWSRDAAFAILNAKSAAPRGQWIEILGAAPGSISLAVGPTDMVLAWNDVSTADPVVKMARVIP